MSRNRLALAGIPLLLALGAVPAGASTVTIYSDIPSTTPYHLASWAYAATSTSEFGELIQFGGASRTLASATVVMVDWARLSEYESDPIFGTSAGWYYPITLNLYEVKDVDGVAQPGDKIASVTETFLIPWGPEYSAACGGTAWLGTDGKCYHGTTFEINFDLTGITVPDEVIYSIVFDTSGTSGPYDSLNFGLSTTGTTVGSNPLPGTAYFSSTYAGFYSDNGAGGTGTFRQDTGEDWATYTGAISFEASVPEPATLELILGGFAVLLACGIRKYRLFKR